MNAGFTTSDPTPAYAVRVMRQAFVLQLGSKTESARRHFEGFIEEVDTGRELRFRSTDEMLEFLGKCFDQALSKGREPDAGCGGESKEGG